MPSSPTSVGEHLTAALGPDWRNLALALAVVAIAVIGFVYIRANERRRRSGALAATSHDATPYLAGSALGIVFAISMVGLAHPVGVSGAVQNLIGSLGRRLFPDNAYWRDGIAAGVTWQVWILIGVVLGAAVAAWSRGQWHASLVPEEWVRRHGASVARRWLVAFFAGVLLEFGAAIAGGCTSGLALSGGMVLAPGAFVFMAAMFASGIPAAWISRRLEHRR